MSSFGNQSSSTIDHPPPGFHAPKSESKNQTGHGRHQSMAQSGIRNQNLKGENALSKVKSSASSSDTTRSRNESQRKYLPYLPQDQTSASGEDVQYMVDRWNEQLAELLKMPHQLFWKEVASNSSLLSFVDTYLRFKSRPHDLKAASESAADVAVGDSELARHIFLVLFRLSTNQEPGLNARQSLPSSQHARIIKEKNIFNLPKILDICSLYASSNPQLTQKMLSNVFSSQHELANEISTAVPHICSSTSEVCVQSVDALEAVDHNESTNGASKVVLHIFDAAKYLLDVTSAISSFVEVYPLAAVLMLQSFSASDSCPVIIATLADVYDIHLPKIGQLLHPLPAVAPKPQVSSLLGSVYRQVSYLGWLLIRNGFLVEPKLGSGSGSGLLGQSPAISSKEASRQLLDGDLLVQTLLGLGGKNQKLLNRLETSWNLSSVVEEASKRGTLNLDTFQLDIVKQLLAESRSATTSAPATNRTLPGVSVSAESDPAILESKLSQIKDLFPDLGNGFLLACLRAYGENPETVIQHILDESFTPELKLLDRNSPQVAKPRPLIPSGGGESSSRSFLEVSSAQQEGRFVRKGKDISSRDWKSDGRDAIAVRKFVKESDLEYDDEYDDSFDDLSTFTEATDGTEPGPVPDPRKETRVELDVVDVSTKSTPRNPKLVPEKAKFYVKDGKNYSYKVAGAVAVKSAEEAETLKRIEAENIHGLGRGGNKAAFAPQVRDEESEDEREEVNKGEVRVLPPRGVQVDSKVGPGVEARGQVPGVQEGDKRAYGRKEQNKSKVGNHNRRDRALKKHMGTFGNVG